MDVVEKILLQFLLWQWQFPNKKKSKKYIVRKKESRLFIDAGEFFLQQVEGGDNIVEDMSNLLSRENMKELAKKTDEGSRYLLKEALHREMRSLMLRYEIPAQEAEQVTELNEAYNKMKGIRNKPDFIEVYQRVRDIIDGLEFQKEKVISNKEKSSLYFIGK